MSPVNTIPVCDASERVKNFQDKYANSDFKTKAFTMKIADVQSIISFIGALNDLVPALDINAVRFYLGRHEEDDENCLIMVPVFDFDPANSDETKRGGYDLLDTIEIKSGSGPIKIDAKIASLCYDFTFPCPQTCPVQGFGLPFTKEQYENYSCTYSPVPPSRQHS
jgi:hypothetical protein